MGRSKVVINRYRYRMVRWLLIHTNVGRGILMQEYNKGWDAALAMSGIQRKAAYHIAEEMQNA